MRDARCELRIANIRFGVRRYGPSHAYTRATIQALDRRSQCPRDDRQTGVFEARSGRHVRQTPLSAACVVQKRHLVSPREPPTTPNGMHLRIVRPAREGIEDTLRHWRHWRHWRHEVWIRGAAPVSLAMPRMPGERKIHIGGEVPLQNGGGGPGRSQTTVQMKWWIVCNFSSPLEERICPIFFPKSC